MPDAHGDIDAADAHEQPDADAHQRPDTGARHCDPTWAFGTPRSPGAAFGERGFHDTGFSLSPDELTVYFSSTRQSLLGDYDLFVATRLSTADSFDQAVPVKGDVNTESNNEEEPSISPDGRWLFYTDQYDIFLAKRDTDTGPFGPGSLVENVSTPEFMEHDPFFARDGKSLYFFSDRTNPSSIFVSVLDDSGRFSDPQLVFPAPIDADAPALASDQLTMFFQYGSQNDTDYIHRESLSERFSSTRTPLEASLDIKWVEAISGDGCTLYFVSLVLNDQRTFSWRVLKMATREPPPL